METDSTGAPAHGDDAIVRIPCVATCRHVPVRGRIERAVDVIAMADVRIRRARRPHLAVSAWLLSGSGRNRAAVLTDGDSHFAPIQLRVGAELRLAAFLALLSDPASAYRLRQPRIGIRPGLQAAGSLQSRAVRDDGLLAARAHAQSVADGWLVVGDVVHQRVRRPARVVRFMREDRSSHFHDEALVARDHPHGNVYLRLAPGEDPVPYADALRRAGRFPVAGWPHGIEPGEVPVSFGVAELVEDLRSCVPVALAPNGLALLHSADIRRHADLGRLLRARDGACATVAAGVMEGLSAIGATATIRAAIALYGERLARST